MPWSSEAETLFSMAWAAIVLDQHSLQPLAIEELLVIQSNRTYWNVRHVQRCLEEEQ